jgi:hypothetical protein
MRAALVLASLAALGATADSPRDPAGLRRVDGLPGYRTLSTVVFPDAPDAPHRFEAVQIFPDRARWTLRREGADEIARRIEYRFGEHVWRVAELAGTSEVLDDVGRRLTLQEMELRRAAITWPAGFAWTGKGARREASVPSLSTDPKGATLGTLVARVSGGRPTHIECVDGEAGVVWTIEVLEWFEQANRTWPRRMRLLAAGELVWSETVDRVSTAEFYVDGFFRPPDRRSGSSADNIGGDLLRELDLRAITYRRLPLAEDTPWPAAEAAWAKHFEAARTELKPRGLALDPTPTFEVDGKLRPRSCLLRLRESRTPPPEDWKTIGDRPGAIFHIFDRGRLNEKRMELLLDKAPSGARLGIPYVRFVQSAAGKRWDLCPPFQEER